MRISQLFARLAFTAIVALAWAQCSVFAADTPAPVPTPTQPPVSVFGSSAPVVGDPGCTSCQSGLSTSSCGRGRWFPSLHSCKKPEVQATLCPNACFGYFQTQWRKWDDVCPLPYTGTGVAPSNPPVMPQPQPMPEPMKPGVLPPMKSGSDLPPVPQAPAPTPAPNKFAP